MFTCLPCRKRIKVIHHLPDQVKVWWHALAITRTRAGACGPLPEGPGPTSSPGSLPALRVARRCSPVGFGRQQDDIVIKSQVADLLISDLQETFKNLHKYQMKLNPAKCTFGVPA